MKKFFIITCITIFVSTNLWAQSGSSGSIHWNIQNGVLTISKSSGAQWGQVGMPNWGPLNNPPWYSYRSSITSVIINSEVATIGDYAFSGCGKLTSVSLPNDITYIGKYSFDRCKMLSSITIPDSVATIGDDAFRGCRSISSIIIPKNVNSIGDDAFSGCGGLLSIIVDASNTKYDSRNNCNAVIETATQNLLFGCENTIIPDGIKIINTSAFSGRSGLISISIPNTVTTIGTYAFSGCSGLTTIDIPSGVRTIQQGTFSGCSGLISISIPSTVTYFGESAMSDCKALTSISIPNTVTTIGTHAFSGCVGLMSVNVPSRVTSIGTNAFKDVFNVIYYGTATGAPWGAKSVNGFVDGCFLFSDSTKSILEACFSNTTGTVAIPNSVTSIESSAFKGCEYVTYISIPSSVTTIGANAFEDCRLLDSIIVPNGVVSINSSTFRDCYSLTYISIPDSVTTIGDDAFRGCTSLTSISIPDSVTTIGALAFSDCTSLTSISIPNSVTTISASAFSDCTSLTSISIPDGVSTIESYTFSNCTNLTAVTLPSSITSIGEWAFSNCSNLQSIAIPKNTMDIGYFAFFLCPKLKTISLSSNYIVGEEYNRNNSRTILNMFGAQVEEYILEDGVTRVGNYAFSDCDSLRAITIPSTVRGIGDYAFLGCTSLYNVTINSNYISGRDCSHDLKSVPYYFGQQVKEYILQNNVTSIGKDAFWDCSNVKITIPSTVTSLGVDPFGGGRDRTILCLGTTPANTSGGVGNVVGLYKNKGDSVIVPCGSINTYQSQWALDCIYYAPSYVIGVPSVKGTGQVTVPSICEDSIVAIPAYGYHFVRWGDGNSENPRYVDITADSTYTAIFEINVYKVDFVDWDDSILSSQQVNHGEAATAPEAPTREGWEFVGWDKNFSSVEENMTIHAQYEAISAIEDVSETRIIPHKVIENGHLYILLPDGTRFDATGKKVE